MKKLFEKFVLKGLASGALAMAIFGANIACSGGNYQEELPSSVKKLRKF